MEVQPRLPRAKTAESTLHTVQQSQEMQPTYINYNISKDASVELSQSQS